MNKKSLFSAITAILVFAVFLVNANSNPTKSTAKEVPENVQAAIQKSCFGCHNSDSQNDKAKDKLDFKKLETLSGPDKVHALREIGKTLKDDDMPPKKFLDKYPDKALSADEKKLLMDWAKQEAKNAM